MKDIYIVWKSYQRRAEVLAPLLNARLVFIPHFFRRKVFRPIDYLYKLIITTKLLFREKPRCAYVQSPPLYAALPALLTGTSYVVDAHNAVWQNFWGKLPLSSMIINKACALVAHNQEIRRTAEEMYPQKKMFTITDPIAKIDLPDTKRTDGQLLVICSFDADEPVETIVEVVETLKSYSFIITADTMKLPTSLRNRLEACQNLRLTGFLETKDYHSVLCSSIAVIVLTKWESIQPAGACEALSSDTQLILSRSSMAESLFGDWAVLVDNSADSIVRAVRSLENKSLNLEKQRDEWNRNSHDSISRLIEFVESSAKSGTTGRASESEL